MNRLTWFIKQPNTDDENNAEWLRIDISGVDWPSLNDGRRLDRFHPAVKVVERVRDAVLDKPKLHGHHLMFVLVQVLLERIAQLVVVLIDESEQSIELLNSPRLGLGDICIEGRSERVDDLLHSIIFLLSSFFFFSAASFVFLNKCLKRNVLITDQGQQRKDEDKNWMIFGNGFNQSNVLTRILNIQLQ